MIWWEAITSADEAAMVEGLAVAALADSATAAYYHSLCSRQTLDGNQRAASFGLEPR
jgi:hypothetical protein